MAKRKKQSKRKTGARAKSRASRFPKVEKRRGRNVYDVRFSGNDSLRAIEEKISELPTPYKIPRNGLVKLTVLSRVPGEKKRAAVTYVFQDNIDPFEININMLDIVYEVYYPTDKRKQQNYLKKVARGNIEQIIVDFDTTGNYKLTG